MTSIHALLEEAIKARASDLFIKAGTPPTLRVDGKLRRTQHDPLTPQDTHDLAYGIIFSAHRDHLLRFTDQPVAEDQATGDARRRLKELEDQHEIDLVFTIPDLARVRANLFLERSAISASLRIVALQPYTIDELCLPPILKDAALAPQGLIVITGPTGSGKTTTMAAIVEEINCRRRANIYTIEEPIEYVFTDKKSVIHQREVGSDTVSFGAALHAVTRQSPDVIVIGEMRDAETMDVAMTASEIGHLVIATLHTVSAAATVDRIINSFPLHMHKQAAAQFTKSLLCVTSQRLVHRAAGVGRLPAVEVMTNAPMVRKSIEEGDVLDLYSAIRDGQHYGMVTMNQALERLFLSEQITYEEAILNAGNATELKQMLRHA